MRIKPLKPKPFVLMAKMKLIMAFIGLSFMALSVNAQSTSCPQLAGQPHYYRVINDNFNTYNYLQADYDFNKNNVIVPSNYINTTGTNDIFLASVHQSSVINWSRHYPNNGTDQALAVKIASNGDIITVGRTQNSSGNHVLFIMRTKSDGTFLWYNYYNQINTDANGFVVVTETVSCHDIVVAACSFTGTDDLILLRTSSTGVMIYYDDHPINSNASTSRLYPYLRGITATYDDGYVVVGNTGHNWDFYGATAFKYDANYCTTGNHALNWWYIYRHQIAVYDLWNAGQRSSTYANAVMEEPSTHNIVLVGYTGDNDQYGTSATYEDGFVLKLTSTGAYSNLADYPDAGGSFVYFNGINMTGTDYIITGNTKNPNTGNLKTLITKVNSTTLAVSWADVYGTGSVNYGHSIYTTPNGYICVGVSNDHTGGASQPFVLAVNSTGQIGKCNTSLSLSAITDNNDEPDLIVGQSTSASTVGQQLNYPTICEKMYDLCGSGGCPQLAGKITYSRVINDAFNTYNFLQADYDNTNNDAIVPSNIASTSDISLSSVHVNSVINFSNYYHLTGNEQTLAAKKAANGDMITAGRTQDAAGDHILFLMRTDATGNVLWYHTYVQANTTVNAFVLITETVSCNDIVVASASFTGSNDLVILRTSSTGTLKYYDDHPITVNGSSRLYPWIRGITATYDDGFVIVGNTGHNWDFYGALIVKYDANYCTTPTHAQNWWYIYRHQLGIYDLWNAGQRSSTYAHGIVEEPNTSHQLAIVGYTGDNDQYGTNATYEDGFVLQLSSAGAYVNLANYSGSDFVFFNGINMAGTDYIVNGYTKNTTSGNLKTLITKISSATLAPSWAAGAKTYGTNNLNVGLSIFPTPNGFLSVGVSNDYTGTTSSQPHLLAVDASGNAGQCYTNFSLNYFSDNNDMPQYTYGTSTSATSNNSSPVAEAICEEMVDLCSSAMKPVQLSGLDNNVSSNDKLVTFYPNPTSGKLNLDIKAETTAQGTVIVTDIQGKQILSSAIAITEGANHFELNIADLKNGIYIIKVSDNKNTVYPVSKITKY